MGGYSEKIMGGYSEGEQKIHFRQEANHIYSHSEWDCHSGSFKKFSECTGRVWQQ